MLDIESSPLTVHSWGLWEQNIGLNQILDTGGVLCYSAKWYKGKEMFFDSIFKSSKKKMLKGIHKLLDEADAVCHYNGARYDIPMLNREFLLAGMTPVSPIKQVDLLRVCKRQFRFPSNKLDHIASALGLGHKRKVGHELWIKCMAKEPKAWAEMERYNKQDVKLLEKLYVKLLPWIKGHANHNLYKSLVCPNCGGKHYQRRGLAMALNLRYHRFQCTDCGTWFRGAKSHGPKPDQKYYPI